MTIKTVLFDFDGTLADSLPLIRRTYQRVFDQMNVPWDDVKVMKTVGLPLRQIAIKFVGEERHTEFFQLYQHYYAIEHDNMTRAYPGTLEMLADLKGNGCRMGVVTSKSHRVVMRSINFLGLERYFDVFIGAEDVTKHKPQPEPILKALELMGEPAATAAYVGDSPFDIMAGKRAGVVTIGVTWGISDRDELVGHEPDYILDTWADLVKIIQP
ncbi:HAD-superfamily hydrolase, subfamily IA, variant 3 [Desulfotomaculum nigrificans CO-1-SRB]|uniref:HAD-superfamily hydrolase, subfamily IA, variant 3 n=1 Tax=Desulfotomaculum nigrificans (strain DSM 14880 / VKM B-2319 / CO-1-SRB) TaxID=868595 RepID=F6B8C2_DESCC|nr:HAD-IA family hydrolase [Desulfotomaculum nigrificans]AEF94686.1 HAD-superfamily hydrolase, subfamily IA, variant 3 [Desulfotomaculum nigrificans CO-1-SRB]